MIVCIFKQPFVDEYHVVPKLMIDIICDPYGILVDDVPDGTLYTLSGLTITFKEFHHYCRQIWKGDNTTKMLFLELRDLSLYYGSDNEYRLGDALKYCDDHQYLVSCEYLFPN